ncbi:type I pullulanase [Paenibacillus taichungensis]|uniref:Type I pullulanase n=1 Tax=Paenibacillus taichungensis TaxID=484184 RepID=A0ABX2MUP9_9BACL|nr:MULTISPECIES: type I pullulanase [Paenibacillus]MEC0108784.1 type I pullulanase [Paenibacillus taichungensis]MEC0196284.1 type I pullulanase [Paenibacillus taichungensis]NUU57763.1 type I pullulanase [Paenibacillus taichungensis]PIH58481.1 type I pullulanase [Paenibacillus sp. LK1]
MIDDHHKLDVLNVVDTYQGRDLGVTMEPQACSFKVWAPTAKQVDVLLSPPSTGGSPNEQKNKDEQKEIPMNKQDQGIWTLKLEGEWNGYRYMYRATFEDGRQEIAVDPYARAVTMNGEMGVIVRLEQTHPNGWNEDIRPELASPVDAVLYELHVRDFSIHESSSMRHKGKYLAFTETGLRDSNGNTLGIDHLAELGITHVHLLPVFDFATVDESKADDGTSDCSRYNWGYDPLHYNVPEGSYASRADEPETRIRELKSMVLALHEKGIGVIMDVVYNHTFDTAASSFEKLVPGYYYRQNPDGTYSNGSGTGNEVATERPMVRKFIIDSVRYWAEEYHVDGFRFDLMGLIDTTTMKELAAELHAEVSPSILLYGEPWGALESPLGDQMTLKGAQREAGFAVFNDNLRGAIKGDSDGTGTGFATGAEEKEDDIWTGVRGAITDFTAGPSETINYVTVHDNLNLWDKVAQTQGLHDTLGFITYSEDGRVKGSANVAEAVQQAKPYLHVDPDHILENESVRRCLLANGIVLTSQGVPLLAAGDELLRSKFGDANSHESGDSVNAIRWEQKQQFKPVYDYYRGLIRLRREHPAFRLRTREEIELHVQLLEKGKGLLAYELSGTSVGDSWGRIIVIYNASKETRTICVSSGTWNVVVEQGQAGTETLRTTKEGQVSVPAISMTVMYSGE